MAKVLTWIKVGKIFIKEDNVRGLVRQGNQTIVKRIVGDDIVLDAPYDKLRELLPAGLI